MDIILERGIVKSFSEDGWLQRTVRQEFFKSKQCEDQPKVDRLSFMAIKTLMHKELLKDGTDFFSKSIYKLIFKEYLRDWNEIFASEPIRKAQSEYLSDWDNIIESEPIWKAITSAKQLDESESQSEFLSDWDDIIESEPIWRAMTSEDLPILINVDYLRQAQIDRVRSDGPIIFEVVNQNMRRFYSGIINLILTRNRLQISLDDRNIAEIPHRDGIEFDTFWAEKFVKMTMSKYADTVSIHLIGEGLFNVEEMINFLNKSIIDKLPRVILPGGFEKYMREKRPVYARLEDDYNKETNYEVRFKLYRERYPSVFDHFCWGYLKEN